MKTYPRKPLVEISPEAQKIYQGMCERIDNMGLIDLEGTLELSVQLLDKSEGDQKNISKCMTEVQQASMVFPMVEKSGWVVRFPIVKF